MSTKMPTVVNGVDMQRFTLDPAEKLAQLSTLQDWCWRDEIAPADSFVRFTFEQRAIEIERLRGLVAPSQEKG